MSMTPPVPGTAEERDALWRLHADVERVLEDARVGVMSLVDYERGRGYVYAYGPDAHRMLQVARAVLNDHAVTHVRLLCGDVRRTDDIPEEIVRPPFRFDP